MGLHGFFAGVLLGGGVIAALWLSDVGWRPGTLAVALVIVLVTWLAAAFATRHK
jgi:anti-sigma-K factor RskA